MNFMCRYVFQYFHMSMFWYKTTVGYIDLLCGHIVQELDQYQELLKQTMVPEDLCAQFIRLD